MAGAEEGHQALQGMRPSAAVRKLLASAVQRRGTPEQTQLMEAFVACILEPIETAGNMPAGAVRVLLEADLSCLEVHAAAGAPRAAELVERFLGEIGVPADKFAAEVDHLNQVITELQATEATLWCRLNMRTDGARADVGFSVRGQLEWSLVDLLMPPSHDTDVLVVTLGKEGYPPPCVYGSSILPALGRSAKFLEFELPTANDSLRLLLPGLSFFRALGFAKPEDNVIHKLNACKPKRCRFRVALGTEGLTRATLRLDSGLKAPAKDLAKLVDMKYSLDDVPDLSEALGDRHVHLDYSVDARGYSVALGFALPR